jgi:hypothetical protein
MSVSRAALISAKIASAAGAVFIAVAAPAIDTTMLLADGGSSSQTPPPQPPAPDGNPWND